MSAVSRSDKRERILATGRRQDALKARVWAVVAPWVSEPRVQATIGGLALVGAFLTTGETA